MKRRDFLSSSLTTVAASSALADLAPQASAAAAAGKRRFKLKYAPHFGMFRQHAGEDPVEQIRFMADQGFQAIEDNGMAGRPKEEQEKIARALAQYTMQMGVFVASFGPNIASGDKSAREQFLNNIRGAAEVAKRVNARWCTVVPGDLEPRLQMDFQTAYVIEALKPAAEICEPAGLVMVLEPLNHWRDHPGLFLSGTPQAYAICKAVGSPSCKILFDIYHEQISEGNLIPNIDRAWDEIAYLQIGDNPGRNEPTTGEINYRNVFKHLHGKRYAGILGMEHGNSKTGREGEQAVIQAYVECDRF
jgi:hydroxypyruvate isomerase